MAEGQLTDQGSVEDGAQRTVAADDVPQLLKSWHQEIWCCGSTALVKLGIVTAALVILAYAISVRLPFPTAALPWAVFALWSMVGAVIASYACTEPTNVNALTARQRKVLESLAALDDVRAVDPLLAELGTLYQPVGFLANAVVSALVRLLPRLDTDTADYVTARLYRYISPQSAAQLPELVITILHLLRPVGGKEALARVAHLIVQDAPTKTQQRVRDEARLCFPDMLAATNFARTAGFSYWVDSLPTQTTASMSWEQFILPQLAIRQMLPRLTTDEFLALEPRDRQRLYRSLLGYIYEYPILGGELSRLGAGYGLELLDIAVRARDKEAIPTVRALVYQDTRASRWVREAARDCLPVFEELARQEKVGRTLLRASSAPIDAEGSLLRPAVDASPTDPQELLRADAHHGGRR